MHTPHFTHLARSRVNVPACNAETTRSTMGKGIHYPACSTNVRHTRGPPVAGRTRPPTCELMKRWVAAQPNSLPSTEAGGFDDCRPAVLGGSCASCEAI